MQGEVHWFPVAVTLLGLLAAALLASRGWSRYQSRRMKLHCPHTGERVSCALKQDTRTGRFADVEICTGLQDPDRIDCGKACLHALNGRRS